MLRIQIKQNINTYQKCENNGLKNLEDPRAFIEYSKKMQDVCKNTEEYNSRRKCNVVIVFNDMIADMSSNKNLVQQ